MITNESVNQAIDYILRHMEEDVTLDDVAEYCHFSKYYFSRLFKETVGSTPQEFLIRLRLSNAAELMRTTADTIGDIALHCGYPNQLHFSQAFKKHYGLPPREWRKQYRS